MTQGHRPKRVCVIGAGPAGLVAAKTLLYDYPKGYFDVTVFERGPRIGGLWPSSEGEQGGMLNPEMRTNISRHTVQFSDFAWPEHAAVFPKAWEVGQYLVRYLEKYSDVQVKLRHKVTRAKRIEDDASRQWKVEYQAEHAEVSCATFDHCIIASGFFDKPKSFENSGDLAGQDCPKILHYCEFRTLGDLNLGSQQGTRVLVVGGSMSGSEVAGQIARQLSSAVHSPGMPTIKDAEKYTVYHLYTRPSWTMPCFLPTDPKVGEESTKSYNSAPSFLPNDLKGRLDDRPEGPIQNRQGHIKPEVAPIVHAFYESMAGSDQSDLGSPECSPLSNGRSCQAPWLTVSDIYSEFVRSGNIVPMLGKLEQISQSSISFNTDAGRAELQDVASIVLATGYDSNNLLPYLGKDILERLLYDSTQTTMPLNLDVHSSTSKQIPDLGFVGFYRSPYWGVMEMQSRYLGALWSGSSSAAKELTDSTSPIPELRKVQVSLPNELAQFPMGDYIYLMEDFRRILDIDRAGDGKSGPVLPGRYLLPSASAETQAEARKSLSQVASDMDDSVDKGKFVARAIFRSMQGRWKLSRTIKSRSEHPSGSLEGTANFHPRNPTEDDVDGEYLYIEEGEFRTLSGLKFRANRRYAHRYTAKSDTLSIWFTKPDNKSVDYLFHDFEILQPVEKHGRKGGWRARAHHLCINDTYDVEYEFVFRGANLQWWTMEYEVRGPEKDYRIESRYER